MYILKDGENVAGMVAVTMYQGDDYGVIKWKDLLENDQVATVHLLAVCPAYRGRSLGCLMLEEAMGLAARNRKKALRLDTLKSNIPAQKMYEKAGFIYRESKRCMPKIRG